MIFNRSTALSAALLFSTSHSITGFSSQQISSRGQRLAASRTTSLASTTEKAVSAKASNQKDDAANSANGAIEDETTDTAKINGILTPDFQKVRDAAVEAFSSKLSAPSLKPLQQPLVHFIDEYFASLCTASENGAKNPTGTPITAEQAMREMGRTLNFGLKYGLGEKKYIFDVTHTALRGEDNTNEHDDRYKDEDFVKMLGDDAKTDFYAAGCDFFRPSMDLEHSLVLGKDNLKQALEQIRKGENVVFFANHQSEADPQVVSCLFETVGEEYGDLAAHVTYVAGHKVTTDPLAVPFSMGRNLLCIHSKKHIDADASTKPAKQKQNLAAMNEMLQMMKDGGLAIWVAPSGGRDRRDVKTGKIPIAPYDQKTVDMFRLMGNKSKKPTHFYPLSMVSYDLCPPPDFVDPGVGEQRNVRFTPIGIAVMDEVPNVGGAEKRHLFTEKAEQETREGYEELLRQLGMEHYIP